MTVDSFLVANFPNMFTNFIDVRNADSCTWLLTTWSLSLLMVLFPSLVGYPLDFKTRFRWSCSGFLNLSSLQMLWNTRIRTPYIKGVGKQIKKVEQIKEEPRSRRNLGPSTHKRPILMKVTYNLILTSNLLYIASLVECNKTYIGEIGRILKPDYRNTSMMLDLGKQSPMWLLTMPIASCIR